MPKSRSHKEELSSGMKQHLKKLDIVTPYSDSGEKEYRKEKAKDEADMPPMDEEHEEIRRKIKKYKTGK